MSANAVYVSYANTHQTDIGVDHEMITRKLNRVRNSYYVYLPLEWCERFGLTETENPEVKISETTAGTLEILPPQTEKAPTAPVRFVMDERGAGSIQSLLVGAYIVGVNSFEISFAEPIDMAAREETSQLVRRLPGFEVLEEDERRLLIGDTSEKQVISPILKRQFSTTKYMLTGLIKAMKTGDLNDAKRITARDEDVDRHRYFVERLCHLALQDPTYARKIEISPSDALHFSLAAKYVERIADHVCGATAELLKLHSVGRKIIDLAEELSSVYDGASRVFFAVETQQKSNSFDAKVESADALKSLANAEDLAHRLAAVESSVENTPSSQKAVFVYHLVRIASYCADIGEVAINRTIGAHV